MKGLGGLGVEGLRLQTFRGFRDQGLLAQDAGASGVLWAFEDVSRARGVYSGLSESSYM